MTRVREQASRVGLSEGTNMWGCGAAAPHVRAGG